MDFMRAMGAMQNPQGYLAQWQMQAMIQQHPEEWKAAQEMFGSDMSRKQKIKALRKLYSEKGIDLDQAARQYGIAL